MSSYVSSDTLSSSGKLIMAGGTFSTGVLFSSSTYVQYNEYVDSQCNNYVYIRT